ncbi:MAG: hypothetical protein ACN4GR_00310 [Arenicellales bacterium]
MTKLRFFEKLDLVDDFINYVGEIGYGEAFKKIAAYLDNPHVCQYFFEKIEGNGWVDVIFNSEFIRNYRSGKIPSLENNQFDWFFMGYLLKVADTTPEQASDYLKSIAVIDDERLHERMIEVMLKLPCETAAELLRNEIEWCQSKENLYGLYPEFAGKLVLHIQECNEKIAFSLINELLKVDAITREVGEPGTESYFKSTDVKAKFSDWEYQSFLNKYVANFVLSSENNTQYLTHLFDSLSDVLSLEGNDPENDYSWVWRNTFEDNDQTRHISGIKEYLLVFIRDLSINLIKENRDRFKEIVQTLTEYEWTIFKRLSIYLCVKFPYIDLDLTKRLISSTDLYESSRTRNEYSLLLDSAFSLVGQEVQDTVYNWIDNEVDLESYIKRYTEHEGVHPGEEEIKDYKAYWKKTRLYLIRNHLEGKRLAEYRALVEEKGVPDHPEYSSYTTSWVGPTSPMTVDEINDLDVEQLVRELKEWKSSGKSMGPSPEGLSRNLSEAIKANIDKYKYSASLFKGLPPTYIRGLFQGLRDNLSNLDHQSWPEIIDLSEWVLSQEYDVETERDVDSDEDPGWSWCRQSIASLLDAGLKKGDGQVPIELKDRVWGLIQVLTQDPDPTPAHEAEYGGSNMGPTTMSINTVRGEAMHALIEYGLWVARNSLDKKICFEDIPEMREILDDHLDPENDPSLAIRSVYGQFFPWLNLLDTNWANEAKYRIFSDDKMGLGDAAWDAYITFCQPYDDALKVVSDIYVIYARKLSEFDESDERERPLENLAAHIITFYWRSKLELDDEVVQVFYQHAPLKLRKYAIEFIGRSLGNNESGEIETNIEERLKELYEWRESQAEDKNEYEELVGFCWWIDADIIDRQWSLNKFHKLLQVQDKLDAMDFAARKLINYFEIDPLKVLDCIEMMLDKLIIQGIYFSWDDSAQDILSQALAVDDVQVKEKAIDLVHKFGSRGFLHYRNLLNNL